MNYHIAVIPGDGIGPEIVAEAKKVLNKVADTYGHTFEYEELLMGMAVPLTHTAEPLDR